jgi:hypothetical protein
MFPQGIDLRCGTCIEMAVLVSMKEGVGRKTLVYKRKSCNQISISQVSIIPTDILRH